MLLDGGRSRFLASRLVALAVSKDVTLSFAESCTGGGVSAAVTGVPGSSDVFMGGVAAYHNRIKERVLYVDAALLGRHGAVSGRCALAMSRGIRRVMGTDYGASVTGVAGPGGGSVQKPVGTVWFAIDCPGGGVAWRRVFSGGRDNVRYCSVVEILAAMCEFVSMH